jgi:hypothetical protein
MSATTTTARIPSDGWVVEVLADGTERPFRDPSMRIMTEAEIEAPIPMRGPWPKSRGKQAD